MTGQLQQGTNTIPNCSCSPSTLRRWERDWSATGEVRKVTRAEFCKKIKGQKNEEGAGTWQPRSLPTAPDGAARKARSASLARQFDFDGPSLSSALAATFDRRQTSLPATTPLALTTEFSNDETKKTQWTAFLKKGGLVETPPDLGEIIQTLQSFLMPPTLAAISQSSWKRAWVRGTWQ